MKWFFLILLAGVQLASAQAPSAAGGTPTQGPYKVGYRCVYLTDSSRLYKPGTKPGDVLHFRPLEVDVWYPALSGAAASAAASGSAATSDADPAIRFGEFIGLLEQRADRFQDDTVYSGLTGNLVGYLCVNLGIADSAKLLNYPTASHRNAKAAGGRFPLLIYLCSYNGICWENVPLFESLAGAGYVVASITSVGRYPGNMTMKLPDLFEQVKDGFFAKDALVKQENVDSEKIGFLGYSWGGLAAVMMGTTGDHVGAVLSLDGSEIHYFNGSKVEDKDFDDIRNSPWLVPDAVYFPYGYLESGGKQTDEPADSIFDILPGVRSPKLYRRFVKATHEDFSCLPALAARLGADDKTVVPYAQIARYFFDYYLKHDTTIRADPSWFAGSDSGYPVPVRPVKTVTISGRVFDLNDKRPVAYVNIGIPGKNAGTVSSEDGSFELKIGPDQLHDSVLFSMTGYRPRAFLADELYGPARHGYVYLAEKVTELSPVVLTGRMARVRRIGNTNKSQFMSVGFPLRSHGTEIGIRVSLGKKPVRVRRFNFNLADSHVDSAVFRLNIHKFQNGAPGENLLERNIFVRIGKRHGVYSIDLSSYTIMLSGDVLVSLEWLGEPGDPAATGAVYFSAGFLNSATWRRETSLGNWKKAGGIGVGFNLEVQEMLR